MAVGWFKREIRSASSALLPKVPYFTLLYWAISYLLLIPAFLFFIFYFLFFLLYLLLDLPCMLPATITCSDLDSFQPRLHLTS